MRAPPSFRFAFFVFRFSFFVVLILSSCQSPRVPNPLTTTSGGNAPDQQLAFWHDLSRRPITCNDEAFHGLLLFLYQDDPAPDYAARVKLMHERKLLPAKFDRPADEAVDRGTLAVAITRSLSIKGGWALHTFGDSPRYAVRELEYLGLFPPSSPSQTFSGEDFVAIIGRLEDYQRGDPSNVPAGVLPGEMAAGPAPGYNAAPTTREAR
jgi:hypothetical protein